MCLRCVQCALSNLKSLVLVRRFSHERQHGDRVFSQPSSSNCNNQRGEYCSAVNSILPAQKEHTGQPWICLPTVIKMIVFLARRASRRDRHRSRILAYWNHPTRTTTTTCLRPHRLILAMTRTRWRRSTMRWRETERRRRTQLVLGMARLGKMLKRRKWTSCRRVVMRRLYRRHDMAHRRRLGQAQESQPSRPCC